MLFNATAQYYYVHYYPIAKIYTHFVRNQEL